MIPLAPIKERLAAATPGPWRVWHDPDPSKVRSTAVETAWCYGDIEGDTELITDYLPTGADAEMIANAPEDIAALVAEVERLRAERDGDGDVESGTLWHAQRDVSRLRNELHHIEALRRKAEIRCESLEAQIDAVRELHRRMPVYDTLTDDCEEHDTDEHAIESSDGGWYCDQHLSFYTCSECYYEYADSGDWPEWPCETIKALGGEQG